MGTVSAFPRERIVRIPPVVQVSPFRGAYDDVLERERRRLVGRSCQWVTTNRFGYVTAVERHSELLGKFWLTDACGEAIKAIWVPTRLLSPGPKPGGDVA